MAAKGSGRGLPSVSLKRAWRLSSLRKTKRREEKRNLNFRALGPIRFFRTDVTDEVSVEASVRRTRQEFGMLHALVNNAGIAHAHRGPLESVTLDDWNRMVASHLTGCFLCSKYAIPHLREARGAIVNIASTRAFQSEPDTEAYAAAKGGIVSFTHALAMSVGPEIRVNCISPGWIAVSAWKKRSMAKPPDLRPIDHTQHPVGRVGEPGDIAGLVAFLISGQSGFITGQTFIVDGGMTRKMIYEE